MVTRKTHKWDVHVVTSLSYFLTVVFVGAALYKVFAWSEAVDQFERFGYASWFVGVTIIVELVAAALVAIPLTRYWGASLIIVTMIAAMLSHLKADEPGEMIAPLILLILATVVTWFGPLKPSEAESQHDQSTTEDGAKPTPSQIAKQLVGFVLLLCGIYVGAIALFGQPPWQKQFVLDLAVTGIMFALAGFGYSLLMSKPKRDDSSERNRSDRTSSRR